MRFSDYAIYREAEQASEIDQIFKQTEKDVSDLFDQLYRGTARMVQSSQKAQLPDELRKSILQDLSRIAQRVRGPAPVNAMTMPKTEHATVDACINDILENISAVSGLGQTGTGSQGMATYDFKSTLNNVKHLVLQRMGQLKDAVFKSIGLIGDIHQGVGDLGSRVGDIHQRVVTQMTEPEQESAYDALAELGRALEYSKRKGLHDRRKGDVRLYAKPGSELSYDPNDSQSILSQIQKMQNPKAVRTTIDGQPGPVLDLTNRNSWLRLMDIVYGRSEVPLPNPRKGDRALGLRGSDGKVLR